MKNTIFGLKTIIFIYLLLFQILNCQTEIISKTKLYYINNAKYISALEYAKIQNIRTLFYNENEILLGGGVIELQ